MSEYEVEPTQVILATGRSAQVFEIVQVCPITGERTPILAYAGPVSANLVAAALNEARGAEVEVSG